MKKLLITLFCCALLSITHKNYAKEPPPIASINEAQLQLVYINIFESGVYDSYLNQLKIFTQQEIQKNSLLEQALASIPEKSTAFEQEGLKLINGILTAQSSDTISKALYHGCMLKQLRFLINDKNNLPLTQPPLTHELVDFIDKLSVWMFTQPDLSKPAKKFMYTETGFDKEVVAKLFQEDQQNFVNNIHSIFANNPRFIWPEKLKGVFNDPALYGDMPSTLFHLNNAKKTKVIRTPNVARDLALNDRTGKTRVAHLNEEFKNYLLATPGKIHLYVNLLGRDEEDEGKVAKIEGLENDLLVGSKIIVVSLDKQKSSDFYFQKGDYEDLSDAHQFKQAFLSTLFQSDGSYYWSNKLDLTQWRTQLAEILEEVHRHHFDGKEELTQAERLDFVEIIYVKIVDALVEKFEPDVMNITCKQSVDRAPSLYMLYYLDHRLKTGATVEDEIQNLYWMYFSPPIAFHNRAGHNYRILRFQSALNKIIETHATQPLQAH